MNKNINIAFIAFLIITCVEASPMSPASYFKSNCEFGSNICLEVEVDLSVKERSTVFRSVEFSYDTSGKPVKKNLWELRSEFVYGRDVFLSPAGTFLVIVTPPTSDQIDSDLSKWELMYFYSAGKFIKSYNINNFIDSKLLNASQVNPLKIKEFDVNETTHRGVSMGLGLVDKLKLSERLSAKVEPGEEYFFMKIRESIYVFKMSSADFSFKCPAMPE